MAIIKGLDPIGQQAVLAADEAVAGLMDNGQEAGVLEIILVGLDPAGQQAVLAANRADQGLASSKQGSAAVHTIRRGGGYDPVPAPSAP